MKYPFLNTQQDGIQNSRRSSRQIRHGNGFMKNGCPNFSYVHRSRKHSKCKYFIIGLLIRHQSTSHPPLGWDEVKIYDIELLQDFDFVATRDIRVP